MGLALVALDVAVSAAGPLLVRVVVDVIEREPAGRLLTRLTGDVATLSQLLQEGLRSTAVGLLSVAVMALVLVVRDLELVIAQVDPLLVGVASLGYRILAQRVYDR